MNCNLLNHRIFRSVSKRILVVEDSKMVNNLLSENLQQFGHTVTSAFSIAEARAYLNRITFDIVILDLVLPDGNGKEIIPLIKERGESKIIILSANRSEFDRYKLFNDGILDYFVKDSTILNAISEINALIRQLEYNKDFTILTIDDSRVVRNHIKLLLEPRNFKVLEASTGEEGLYLLKKEPIDLVLLDMELPDIHGLKILEKIKSGTEANIPVLVISGKQDSEMIRQTYKLGAAEFLHKPYIPEELLLKINYWLKQYMAAIEIECSNQLMKEYKDTIDESAIVSKTDTRGVITYVNEAFCTIAGYKKAELIGKLHSIVRHPDMPSEVFAGMWETLKQKKTWKGVIKNLKKDGSHYWVDTVIRPIVDINANVVEYIAIRNDITDIQDLKERLSQELNIASENFKEAYQLSKEYERAIDESTILSRTDLEGKIIYANRQFEAVSGYPKEELVGRTHGLIHHPDTPNKVIEEIWNTIQSGRIWRGVLKNRAKNGNDFWVNSVILPIQDSAGNTIEYMSIRNDVTKIMELHLEIEDTQKELIYRMGELAEKRSKETGNHIKRVAAYSKLLATKYGLSDEQAELLFMASPMHDIGKLSTPDAILQKPGKLDDAEWAIMRQHSQVGYDLLQSSEKPILQAAAIIALHHHEKWNGSGYPAGLKGEEIHIFGRITALADVFDALGSARCYKKAWDDGKIMTLLREERGHHFDPGLVDIFLENIDAIFAIREKYRDS